ncbi:pancreatic lipase-related protein 2-like [Galleria mellonella]|uniref:Pancreatic lipase-related protein 2-like n=1 Tax=Galleria mellonella TaxID=7137 RepID=A0A6J3BQW9_GALME|nr:pancreatic lipase-related protein 2-like [Galleria mellonella]XP_052756001.1 pancreatic lipase-related protein 2-like [Galleria mellonella]
MYVCTLKICEAENGSDYGSDYGDEWLYFVDDNGTTHIMNFSSLPPERRGLIYGKPHFYLYTRQNLDQAEELFANYEDDHINSTYFNESNDIKAVTHGWLSNTGVEWVQNIKNRLLQIADLNVILVDWGDLAANPMYPWPALCTRFVGRRLSRLLNAFRNSYQVQNNTHLIGHSLGAHVMGYAGMFSKERVYRITGLDPARPLFELPEMGPNFSLDKSDADFVDIIHTCGGSLGYQDSHGHADFYPNKGRSVQPGCKGSMKYTDSCSHGRACEYFYESIFSEVKFKSYPCENWERFERSECKTNATLMGYPAIVDNFGDYFLHTRNESTYAIEEEETS